MNMQQQYKTEQLISRTNYKKHKKKLHEIKNQNNHSTSLQFYNSGVGKPLDRKKILMMKMKREEIQQENQYLRQKIEKINGIPALPARKKMYSEEQNRKRFSHSVANGAQSRQNNRYDKVQDDKIQVDSDCGDGENIKCVVPPNRNKIKYTSISQSKAYDYNAIIFNLTQKQKKPTPQKPYLNPVNPLHPQSQNPQGQNSQSHPSTACLQPNKKLSQIIRQSTNLPKDQLLYCSPQKQSHRLVLFKKTKIPYPMVSFLIQISLIDRQVLIIAYGMGIFNEDFKLLLSKKRSKRILEEIKGDYEMLWNRVQVQQTGIKILGIGEDDDERDQSQANSEDKDKATQQKRYQITQDFLQRNYYTLMKQEKNKQVKEDKVQLNQIKKPIASVSANNSGNKPRSIFRNKIEYHKQKLESLNNENKNDKSMKNEDKSNGNVIVKNQSKNQHEKPKQAIKDIKKQDSKQPINHPQQKSLPNNSKQQNYSQIFEQQEKLPNQSSNYPQQFVANPPSKKLQKSQQINEYSQNFENNSEIQQYSMQYESNPSKVVNNKSSIQAVKKKTINNNNSAIESLVEYYVESQEGEQDKPKEQNGKDKNKGKEKKEVPEQEVQEQYEEEFD